MKMLPCPGCGELSWPGNLGADGTCLPCTVRRVWIETQTDDTYDDEYAANMGIGGW